PQPRPTIPQPRPTLSQGSHVFPTAQAPPPLRRAMSSTHLHSNAPTATQTRHLSQPSHGHRQRVHSTGNASAPRIMNAAPSQSHQQIRVHGNGHCEYSKCTGRKKALCIGINYKGHRRELRGCVNDITNVRRFLTSQWGFKDGDIVMLMDETANPRQMPTRTNMTDAMRWLVKDARPHDSLFFHYSGHGGQIPTKDGDEIGGFDEVIYPVDYKTAGVILDDEMHRIMVKSLPQGCRLTAVFDSCHSGTALDLPYVYHTNGRLRRERGVSVHAWAKKMARADVVAFAARKDNQRSADTVRRGVAVGAMSYAFVTTLSRRPTQNYQELLRSLRDILRQHSQQKARLSSSRPIDTRLRFIL
ncbi:hypothetical protein PAXRUDRAFT_824230, partial [Paxillus rubicundulus Ve08.2h10]